MAWYQVTLHSEMSGQKHITFDGIFTRKVEAIKHAKKEMVKRGFDYAVVCKSDDGFVTYPVARFENAPTETEVGR